MFEAAVPGFHEDHRRIIIPILNGDVTGFGNMQVKGALVKSNEIGFEMGCHYHPEGYDEVYVVLVGQIDWTLYEHSDPTNQYHYTTMPGQRLVIRSGWAHLAKVAPNTILVGISSKPYPVDNPSSVDIRVPRENFN